MNEKQYIKLMENLIKQSCTRVSTTIVEHKEIAKILTPRCVQDTAESNLNLTRCLSTPRCSEAVYLVTNKWDLISKSIIGFR